MELVWGVTWIVWDGDGGGLMRHGWFDLTGGA